MDSYIERCGKEEEWGRGRALTLIGVCFAALVISVLLEGRDSSHPSKVDAKVVIVGDSKTCAFIHERRVVFELPSGARVGDCVENKWVVGDLVTVQVDGDRVRPLKIAATKGD